jgi:PAS domain S-box-containing protein/putative nucleotidyltransferase with HDIG domain
MPKVRVLVVEDESLVARDIQNMLRSLSYEVLGIVASGEQALQRASKSAPDLVLMDIVLKGDIDGITAAEKLWEEFNIPVIYLTAYADETTFQRAKLTRPFGYLLKPFEERELQTTIEMALYKSRMELKLREREEWLSTVLKSIGDGIIATDQEGLITFMNPLAEKMTGWTQDEALNKLLRDVFCLEGSSSGKVSRPEKGGGAGENILFSRKGCQIPVEQTSTPIIDRNKTPRGNVLVFRNIALRKTAEQELKESYDRLNRALEGIIRAMAATIEMRDPYTAGHQRRVSKLACAIARKIGLPERQIEGIRMAGEIHDIGKIYVPAEILSKPGKLTDIEFTIIKTHSQVGYDILKNIEFPWPIADIVVQHHERLDGSGYPAHLKGNAILPEANIIIVADVVEAMSSHRPYRPSHGIDKAITEITQNRGVLYDAAVVDHCVRLFRETNFSFE